MRVPTQPDGICVCSGTLASCVCPHEAAKRFLTTATNCTHPLSLPYMRPPPRPPRVTPVFGLRSSVSAPRNVVSFAPALATALKRYTTPTENVEDADERQALLALAQRGVDQLHNPQEQGLQSPVCIHPNKRGAGTQQRRWSGDTRHAMYSSADGARKKLASQQGCRLSSIFQRSVAIVSKKLPFFFFFSADGSCNSIPVGFLCS